MRKFKFKFNARVLVAGIVAAGTFAFKAPINQEWVFTGTSQSEIKSADSYSLSEPAPTGCDNSKPLPCSITVDAADEVELQAYLDAHNTTQIMNEANGRRN